MAHNKFEKGTIKKWSINKNTNIKKRYKIEKGNTIRAAFSLLASSFNIPNDSTKSIKLNKEADIP